jgi:hypothetical protein
LPATCTVAPDSEFEARVRRDLGADSGTEPGSRARPTRVESDRTDLANDDRGHLLIRVNVPTLPPHRLGIA